jgi:hypothetical protein
LYETGLWQGVDFPFFMAASSALPILWCKGPTMVLASQASRGPPIIESRDTIMPTFGWRAEKRMKRRVMMRITSVPAYLDIPAEFFQLERTTVFKLAPVLSGLHTIYNRVFSGRSGRPSMGCGETQGTMRLLSLQISMTVSL